MKKYLFSFIVPTHNSAQSILNLLDSINTNEIRRNNLFEVVIIDDHSADDTVALIKENFNKYKFPIRFFINKRNYGPAKSRNLGVKKAKGQYVIFLDGDVSLKKNSLKNIYSTIKDHKNKAFTGIWDYHQNTKSFFPQFKAIRDWSYWFIEKEEGYRYYLFSTRIAGIEKKLFNRLGGFDESYPEPTVEDMEFTYRIERKVPIKFCPNVVVNHEFEGFIKIAIKYFKRTRDWIKLFIVRRQFDPVATSKKEAIKPFVVASLVILLLSIFIFRQLYSVVFFMTVFLYYLFIEFKFFRFIFLKKGFFFLLISVPTSIILHLVILTGAFFGFYDVFRSYISALLNGRSAVEKTA